MKTKIFAACAVGLIFASNVFAVLSGSGTQVDPYLIQSLAEFDEYAADSSYWNSEKYVRLECDIDLAGRTYTTAVIAPDTNMVTANFQGTSYRGQFDGGGHIIRNLTIIGTDTNGDGINNNDYVGLFGKGNLRGAEIKNLGIEDANINGGKYVGAIIGLHDIGTIRRCYAKGIINGYQYVGGIAGYPSFILDCYTDVSITANSYCGGIAGMSVDAVGYCLALGTVTSTSATYSGKLVGYNYSSVVFDCIYNSESGGVSKSIGTGTGSNIKGFTIAQLQNSSTYLASGWDFSGETANGQKDAWYMPANGYPKLAWEAGYIEVPFVDGITEAAATTILNNRGFNTTIRQAASMTVPQGSVCGTLPGNGSFRNAGSTIEVVVSTGPLGDGSAENPYRISSASDIDAVDDDLGACYLLASDIDLGDKRYGTLAVIAPISNMADPPPYHTTPFSGTFDGGSHTISNLFFSGYDYNTGGLIGKTTADAVVRNLRLTDALIVSIEGADIGGLVGTNYGKIYQCSVSGRMYQGAGISLSNYGLIEQSFSDCRIGGSGGVAGLVYTNYNDIYNCYSQGTIHSGGTGGGLCYSLNGGTITNSYAAVRLEGATKGGLIYSQSGTNMIENCWYDTSVSGVTQSDGGSGRPSVDMFNITLYSGWGDGVWTINNGYDHPRLAWQNIAGTTINNPSHNYGGGSGTAGDPYRIYTAEQLDTLWRYPFDWEKQFKLMADIELGSFGFHRIGYAIGFNGTFDGNGYTIRNLNSLPWYATDYKGLFAYIRQGGTVKNLTMENPYEFGDKYFGPIAASNAGTISNCHVINTTMRVLGHIAENTHSGAYQYIGGIAGVNTGLIENCSASGNIYGDNGNSLYIGGIAGYNNNGTIENCTFNGQTGYAKYCGGIAGVNYSGSDSSPEISVVSNCMAVVETFEGSSTANDYIGGLVGVNRGVVQSCSSSGIVRGQDYVGGLVGGVTLGTYPSCQIYQSSSSCMVTGNTYVGGLVGSAVTCLTKNCFATGNVTGTTNVGGFAGGIYPNSGNPGFQIWNCYATGNVQDTINTTKSKFGGFAGSISQDVAVYNCYATGNVTADADYVGGFSGYGGSLRRCYAKGNVIGKQYVGGMTGYTYISDISDCYSTGNAKGTAYTGGFVGKTAEAIVRSYSCGDANGSSPTGGFVGYAGANVVSNCRWNLEIQSHGVTDGAGAGSGATTDLLACTTAQMFTKPIYTDIPAKWDFVGETVNGTVDYWRMCVDGVSYPRLAWEFGAHGDFVCEDGVDLGDYSFFAARWLNANCANTSSNNCNGTDLDFSGAIDWKDMARFCQHWLEGVGQ